RASRWPTGCRRAVSASDGGLGLRRRFVDPFVASSETLPRHRSFDLGVGENKAHGCQSLIFSHGYDDQNQSLPLVFFCPLRSLLRCSWAPTGGRVPKKLTWQQMSWLLVSGCPLVTTAAAPV